MQKSVFILLFFVFFSVFLVGSMSQDIVICCGPALSLSIVMESPICMLKECSQINNRVDEITEYFAGCEVKISNSNLSYVEKARILVDCCYVYQKYTDTVPKKLFGPDPQKQVCMFGVEHCKTIEEFEELIMMHYKGAPGARNDFHGPAFLLEKLQPDFRDLKNSLYVRRDKIVVVYGLTAVFGLLCLFYVTKSTE